MTDFQVPRCAAYPECFCGAMGWITACSRAPAPQARGDSARVERREGAPSFVCADCGADVYSFGAAPATTPIRCATCEWLASQSLSAADREQLRRFLLGVGAL